MPREVTLPPIRLSPEELGEMLFKKNVANSRNLCEKEKEIESGAVQVYTTPKRRNP